MQSTGDSNGTDPMKKKYLVTLTTPKATRCSRVTISGCRTVGPETVATAFGGSRRADTASNSSNRQASLSLGLSEPSAHRLATGDALHALSAAFGTECEKIC